jgi:tetratricopeptide (TPR) repeat protein
MTEQKDVFQDAMNQGHSAAWDQRWDKAVDYYRQALEASPNNPNALTSLGLAFYELQSFKEALACYQLAAKYSPQDPLPIEKVAELNERMGNLAQSSKIYMIAGDLYAKNRDLNKAVESWSQVIRLNPEHLIARSRLAMVYERLGRKQQALNEYLAISSMLQHAGEVQKAIQTVNHALQIIPGSNEATQALALLKTGQLLPKPSRPKGATGPLVMSQVRLMDKDKLEPQPSESLDPIETARQKAMAELAGMLFEQESISDQPVERRGLQSIMQGAGLAPSKQIDQTKILLHLSQAIDLQSRSLGTQAIAELERVIEAGLDHPAVYYDLGLLLVDAGSLDGAIRVLQHSANTPQYSLPVRLLLGKIYQSMDRIQEAAIEYLEALRIAEVEILPAEQVDELRQLYEPLIDAQSHQTDLEAQERLCININELLVRANWRERLNYARQQLPSDGGITIPLAEILIESKGTRVVDSITTINQYARNGMHRAAMEEAYYALQYSPTYLPLHSLIGDMLLQQNRAQEAVEKFTIVAQTYSARGELERATDMFYRIIELAPMNLNVRSRLIDQLVQTGNVELAVNESIKLAEVHYSLADLVTTRKTYTQTLRLAQDTGISKQVKVNILQRMADIDLQSLDWRQAVRVFEQIRTLEPDDEEARENLIDINFRLGQANQALVEIDNYISHLWNNAQKEQATRFLEKMVEEKPKQVLLHRRLAELYRLSNRPADAISQLDMAGDILMEAGDQKGAREIIMAILALDPPNASEYQTLLAQLRDN